MHAALLTLAAVGIAAPVPKGQGPKLYFPTAVGATRVLELATADGTAAEVTETVTKVVEKDGVFTVTVERVQDGTASTGVYRVSAGGVTRDGRDAERLLDPAAKAGEAWTTTTTHPRTGRVLETATHTARGVEEIEVPAGKFQALRVDVAYGRGIETTHWFAAGVGAVRIDTRVAGKTAALTLKLFTPGDGRPKDESKTDK